MQIHQSFSIACLISFQIVDDYKDYMVKIVKLLGYNCANVTEEVQEIIDFETVLAKVCIYGFCLNSSSIWKKFITCSLEVVWH